MAISLTGATVDTGVPAQNVRAASNPVISTAGNDQQAIAHQQLASAVPAPALLAAYSTGIAPQPKLPAKLFSSAPSSTFATQFLAQDAGEEDDMALFELPVPAPLPEEPAANDYLNDLRAARGEVAVTKHVEASPAGDAAEAAEVSVSKAAAATVSETSARSAAAPVSLNGQNLLGNFFRRPTIVQAKGVSAYQLAQARNTTTRSVTTSNSLVAELAN